MRGPQPWKTNRARVLRAADTSAEAILWSHLRSRRLGGWKFVRQVPIGPYFVDFLCRDARLIVEVDGGTHGEATEIAADQTREQALAHLGYRVVRVWNGDIFDNVGGVLDMLLRELEESGC